jgi:dienelactone hydrolase
MKFAIMLTTGLVLAMTSHAQAAVKTKAVTYSHDGVALKGYLVWDDAQTGKRPGVLVVHEWWGINDYAKKRAEQLAGMGYVAFACDMYGDGKLVDNPKDAGMLANGLRKDHKTWMGRANAAVKVLQDDPNVDPKKIAAIGYCFGGSTALELAHTAGPIAAAVGFHSALPPVDAAKAKNIKARILIAHGADDKFISDESIQKTKDAYDAAKVNYRFVAYPGAVHSYTVPDADARMLAGMRYNADADRQSWADMTKLFVETFGK